nr:4703_t:CDS:2 [Entrophospora candida]
MPNRNSILFNYDYAADFIRRRPSLRSRHKSSLTTVATLRSVNHTKKYFLRKTKRIIFTPIKKVVKTIDYQQQHGSHGNDVNTSHGNDINNAPRTQPIPTTSTSSKSSTASDDDNHSNSSSSSYSTLRRYSKAMNPVNIVSVIITKKKHDKIVAPHTKLSHPSQEEVEKREAERLKNVDEKTGKPKEGGSAARAQTGATTTLDEVRPTSKRVYQQ